MPIISFGGKTPVIEKGAFVAENATLIGDVVVRKGASIWFGAVLRGDINRIEIGEYTSIQDNSVLHVDYEKPVIVGNYVTVGHNAILHGCTIEDFCLVGMGAVVLDGARVKRGSVVAAGAVVREHSTVPQLTLVAGIPAAEKKKFDENIIEHLRQHAEEYAKLAKKYM